MKTSTTFPLPSICVLFLFLLLSPLQSFAQELSQLQQFNDVRIDYNKSGMLILGSWAVGNMVWGGVGASQTTGQTKAFHQMNMYWNSVNLIIAGFGYWQATSESPGVGFLETMQAQNSIEKILLFNAGLDLAYIAGGLYLKERGVRIEKDQFVGFGKSIMLQGAFLLTFDVLMYSFHTIHAKEIPTIMEHLSLGPTGFSMQIPF